MKNNLFKVLFAFACLFSVQVKSQVSHLVISQVYGGGGNTSAPYQNDFVELFNPTGSTVSLTGFSVQYASAAGTSWTVGTLTGSIPAGKYYLIKMASGGAVGALLPTPDLTVGAINMSGTTGKVLLANTTTPFAVGCPTGSSIIDFVGYGTSATCNEGSSNAPAPSNTTADIRASAGCTDANVNSTDFSVGTPTPRNSSTAALYCSPSKFVITSISPTSPIAGSGFNVTVVTQDAGNNANNVLATTAFSLSTNGNAGAISGTTSGSITVGTNSVTITGVILPSAGTGVTLTATRTSGDNLSAGTSSTFTVLTSGGTPTKFAITSISPSTPVAGSGFDVTIQSQDNSNAVQNVSATTAFSLSTNGNAGTLSGTVSGSITAGNNSVTITGVILSTGGTGVTLTATRTSGDVLTAGTSSAFTVLDVASQLTFVGVPSSGVSSTNLASFTVEARRPDNSVDVNYTGTITVSKASGPGTLSGTTAVAAVAGVATFSSVQFDQSGTYTLNASSGSLTQATSSSIVVSQSPVTWNFATAAPSSGTPYANLSISNITQGNNNGTTTMITSVAASSGYTGASGTNNAGAATVNGALNTASSTYFEFTLTPASGYYVNLSGINFGSRSTGTGPSAYTIRSSKDNYVATVATGTLSTSSTWVLQNPSFTSTLSGAGSPITFRVYGHSGTGAVINTAVWRIDDVVLTLDVQQCNVTASTSSTGVSCNGGSNGSATVSASGGTGFTYSWSPSGGTAATATGLSAGTYTCLVTSSVGCTVTKTVTVNQPSSALSASSSKTDISCNNGSDGTATVVASGGTPSYTYSWAPSGGTGATASGLSSGTYTCTITDANSCATTQTVTINQPSAISTSVSSQTPVSCNGGSDGSATVMATGGTPTYSYSWAPAGGTTATATGLTQGTYTCTVTDVNGCTKTQTVTIAQPTAISTSVSSQTNVSCNGGSDGSAIVLASGGTPTYTYSWAPSGGTAASVSGLAQGTYTCTVTDANSCAKTQTVTISQPTALVANISASPISICAGSSSILTGSTSGGTGGVTYSWNTGSTANTVTVSPSSDATYTLTVVDANGCTNIATKSITVNSLPTISITGNSSVCLGSSTTLTAAGAVSYSWNTGNSIAAVTVSPSTNTTYTVTGTDANGCSNTATQMVTVNSSPSVSISGTSSICTGSSTTLTASGASSYSWNNGDNTASTTVSPTSNTTYTVTGTDANGCVNTASQLVTVNTLPTVSITGSSSVCIGSSTILTASGASTYSWSNGDNTAATTVSPSSTSSYTVTGTDNNGCIGTATSTVTVNSLPSVSASANPTLVCSGDPSVLTATGATSYSWNTGATGSVVSVGPTSNTTYTVAGTDNNGCSNTATVAVTVTVCTTTPAEALIFDGVDDKISGTNASLPQGTVARSFTAWIKPSRVTGAAQTIFSYGNNATNAVSGLLVVGGNLYYVGGGNDFNGGSAAAITPNVWTHVAATLNGSVVRLYVNGVLKATGNLATPAATSGTAWAMGNTGWSGSPLEQYEGTMDEVTVWSKALSAAEVSGTLNRETQASGQTGLIGLYHFNQGFASSNNTSVTSLTDASTTASTGTLSGFTLTGSSSNWIAPGRGGKTYLMKSFCGTTMTDLSSPVQCELVANATNYQWEFTDIATSSVYTYLRGNSLTNFYFNSAPQLTYGKTYSVQVKAYVNNVWGEYGESCTISTPSSIPVTNITSPACGTTLSTWNTPIICTAVNGATNYEWEVINVSTSQVYTKFRGNNLNNFYIYSIKGLSPNTQYSVKVRPIVGSSTGTYGSVCLYTTPSGPEPIKIINPDMNETEETIAEEIKFNVFPNPNNGIFTIESTSIENVEVIVYDAIGKVIVKETISSNLQSFNIAEKESGIYFIRVTQNSKAIYSGRIVKE